jgi:hypothetical protein
LARLRAGGLVIAQDVFFASRAEQIVALTLRYAFQTLSVFLSSSGNRAMFTAIRHALIRSEHLGLPCLPVGVAGPFDNGK